VKLASKKLDVKEYTVDELARCANTTVRNVRAYQDRGILAPPERRGRVGVYGVPHLARLRLIHTLLGRGYSVGNIHELLKAVENGYDVRQMLGLQQALSGPWSAQPAETFSAQELHHMFGGQFTAPVLARALALGLIAREGTQYRAANPPLLRVGQALAAAGLRMDDVLGIGEDLRKHVQYASDQIVRKVGLTLDRYKDGVQSFSLPIEEVVQTLRSAALEAVAAEMSRALGESANQFLSDQVAAVVAEHAVTPRRKAPQTKVAATKVRSRTPRASHNKVRT
jgi:DNA-binding transcriptional MerR regulator